MTDPNDDALHENVEQIAVPSNDIVAGSVEELAEPLVDDAGAGDTGHSESDQGEDRT